MSESNLSYNMFPYLLTSLNMTIKFGGFETHSHVFLLAIEAHPNVVPQWSTLRSLLGGNAVLGQCNVVVGMQLKHGPGRHYGLHIGWVKTQRVAEILEGHLILALLQHQRVETTSF